MALDRFVVVLVRTEGPLNLGSVARLCGNYGCELRLVDVVAAADSREALRALEDAVDGMGLRDHAHVR